MNLNYKKIGLMTLICIGIGLSCFLSAILLLTDYTLLKYVSLFLTYGLGIYLVNVRRKYSIIKK